MYWDEIHSCSWYPMWEMTWNWVQFLTAILHRGLRNDFFSCHIYFFHILFGLLFSFFIWSFISLFSLDFYFPLVFGLLLSLFNLEFYFPFLFGLLFLFFLWTYIQSRSHFKFLPIFFYHELYFRSPKFSVPFYTL